jgi:uncharacterized protein (DUF305 family)
MPSRLLPAAILGALVLGAAPAPAPSPDEQAFLAANRQAMERMMAAMMIQPTGSIDRDFVAMMSAHHQGAIDMAALEIRYGKNERLRRIAQEIIVTQREEIPAMRLAVGEPPPPGSPPLPE